MWSSMSVTILSADAICQKEGSGVSCVGRPWSYTSLGHGVLSPLSGARQLPRGSLWIDLVTVDPLGACGFAPHVLLKDLLSTQHEARHRVCEECRGQWTE